MEIELQITPMGISEFLYECDLDPDTRGEAISAYVEYLDQNKDKHHYDDMTKEQWTARMIDIYLTK